MMADANAKIIIIAFAIIRLDEAITCDIKFFLCYVCNK